MSIKKLATQTVIYGASSIFGRLLNWFLVPLYTFVFTDTAQTGIISNLYGYASFLLIFLTFGMETTYFRFSNKENYDKQTVYRNLFTLLTAVSLLFFILTYTFLTPISQLLNYADTPQYILIFAAILAIDVVSVLPFAQLRREDKPMQFAALKVGNIILTVILTAYFLVWKGYGVEFVFIANLIGSGATFLLLLPAVKFTKRLDWQLCKQAMKYAYPLVIMGLAGLIPQNGYTVLLSFVLPDDQAKSVLGEFAPNFKLGVLMALFTQSFRYAFEPYFFSRNNDAKESRLQYARLLDYFVLFGLILFLIVSFNVEMIVQILGEEYRTQNEVIPYIFMGFLVMGMNYTISLWYKVTDKTVYGGILNIIGAVAYIVLFFTLFPMINTLGIGMAFLLSQVLVFFISYFWSRKYYAVPYHILKIWMCIIAAIGAVYYWQ